MNSTSAEGQERKHGRSRKRVVVWVAIAFILCYVSTYVTLSRMGMATAREYDWENFLYVPTRLACCPYDERVWQVHWVLAYVFFPANVVDHYVFGAPWPARSAPFRF
jgi:hypothetical protein